VLDFEIVVHPSAEDNGMANMVAQLMRDNLEASAYKNLCFHLLKATVGLEARDAGVEATLLFNRGSCVIYDGIAGKPDLRIVADSEAILELSSVRIVAGMPFYLDSTGMGVLSKLLLGDVKIEGAVTSPLALNLLTIVLSVN
jgi:hypothetical protein